MNKMKEEVIFKNKPGHEDQYYWLTEVTAFYVSPINFYLQLRNASCQVSRGLSAFPSEELFQQLDEHKFVQLS